ncbi:MAG: H-NS family nucleoid-associated regulatory protein [Armatimonadota bacterium]
MSKEPTEEIATLRQQKSALLKEAEAIERQIAQAMADARKGIVAEVKALIVRNGITAAELGYSERPGSVKAARQARRAGMPTPTIKYRDAQGRTWSGGRGRKPQWVLDALAEGIDLEQFRV